MTRGTRFPWLLAMASLSLVAGAGSGPVPLPLDDRGFIRDWLVLGPYPSYVQEAGPQGFGEDLLKSLGGEVAVELYAGMRDQAVFAADKARLIAGVGATNEWGFSDTRTIPVECRELHWNDAGPDGKPRPPVISLDDRFGPIKDHLVAYAACYLFSPTARQVQIRLGSDDDYKLFINHEAVGGLSVNRAAEPDSNIHVVALRQGLNPILLKVVDRLYGHAFCLAVTDRKGKPMSDLHVVLDNPKVKYARECPSIGRVDAVEGDVFARLELAGDAPYFPGLHTARVAVAAGRPRSARLSLLVTDGRGHSLWRDERDARLTLEEPFRQERAIAVESAGPVTLTVAVEEQPNGTPVASLHREVVVLDPGVVATRLEEERQVATQLAAKRAALQQTLAQKELELKARRTEIGRQYDRIEAHYAERRRRLATTHGQAGLSVDEPLPVAATVRRLRLCLNGDLWEMAPATAAGPGVFDARTPPRGGWSRTRVPVHCLNGYFRAREYPVRGRGNPYGPTEAMPCAGDFVFPDVRMAEAVWFRLAFELPADWQPQPVRLRLENAKVHIRVLCNDSDCGEDTAWCGVRHIWLDGLKPGTNLLQVYTGSGKAAGFGWNERLMGRWGLMGDVWLEEVPELSVTGTWAMTSVRDARLDTRAWITNRSEKARQVTVRQLVAQGDRVRKRLGERTLTLPAEREMEVRFGVPWTNPELWGIGGDYGAPVLYQLVTEVIEGVELRDRHTTRFGFREFWIEGPHFYLNGKRIFLQGDVGMAHTDLRPMLKVALPLLRADQINLIRNHDAVYNAPELFTAADEMGMLVCAQMYPLLQHLPQWGWEQFRKDADGQGYLSAEEFMTHPWHLENLKNYARWVTMVRNHPSVVILSTDNEIFTQAWDRPEQLQFNLRNDRLGALYEQFVKQLDPTRVLTRDGDQGTWGPKGKWQEVPPCDTANYHYPDFSLDSFVRNWESVYGGRPALFGETLYNSYGAWDGWVGAIPTQVAMKAKRCREVMALYRELEVPGAVYMGLSSDGFIQLDEAGAGPWCITPAMRAEYKDKGVVQALPRYPYLPVPWPSLSGPGAKNEVHMVSADFLGHRCINWFDAARATHVRNAVNDAYRETLLPMPPLKPTRAPEVLLRVTRDGAPVPRVRVVLTPADGRATGSLGALTDSRGTAWFVLEEPGRYTARAGGVEVLLEANETANAPPTPGFAYLTPKDIELP